MLSRSSQYALRTLTWLALQPPGTFHLAREAAQELGLPAPFLGKVLQPLVGRGLLQSQRGRTGGFRLARPADQILLREVIETQEELPDRTRCLLGQADCDDASACLLHDSWKRASEEMARRLANTTIQALADHARAHPERGYPLPRVLAAPAPGPASTPLPGNVASTTTG